jgi:hypothetical protein
MFVCQFRRVIIYAKKKKDYVPYDQAEHGGANNDVAS